MSPSRIRRGKKIQTSLFSAYLERGQGETNQFFFVVSKKTAKTAVLRHRIKRILSQAARKLPARALNVTIVPLQEILTADPERIKEELKKIIE